MYAGSLSLSPEVTGGAAARRAGRDHVGHKPLARRPILAEDNHGIPNLRMSLEGGLDFPEFHPKAPYLDLIVTPPEEFDAPVRPVAGQVASPIEETRLRESRTIGGRRLIGGADPGSGPVESRRGRD